MTRKSAIKKGIFEYVLGGEADSRLLNIRVFDKKTIKAVYRKQTAEAEAQGVSNCPLCAIGRDKYVLAMAKRTIREAGCEIRLLAKTAHIAKGRRVLSESIYSGSG